MDLATAILAANDLETVAVEVPEWGVTVHVRGMTARERDAFELTYMDGGETGRQNFRSRLACLTLCDADGKRLFSFDDLEQLSGKSAAAMQRVFDASMKLNGFTDSDVEELAGN